MKTNKTKIDAYISEIESQLNQKTPQQIQQLKIKLAKKYKLNKIPTNIEILTHSNHYELLRNKLLTKPGRTESGVTVCALMTAPIPCPHGKCTYCPGGLKSAFGDVPQSYTGNEPASKRGKRNYYDPFLQVFNRLEQYTVMGHNIDKIEMIFMGGTFPSFPKQYQYDFDFYSFKALNDFSYLFFKENIESQTTQKSEPILNFDFFKTYFHLPGSIQNSKRTELIQKQTAIIKKLNISNIIKSLITSEEFNQIKNKHQAINYLFESMLNFINEKPLKESLSLSINKLTTFFIQYQKENNPSFFALIKNQTYAFITKSQIKNQHKIDETSNIRCVGLTIETRPDYGLKEHGLQLLQLGTTRIELGVQSLNNSVLEEVNRGHTVEQTIQSIYELKELGFKLNFHIMLGLPSTTKEDDINTIKTLFSNPSFRPDMLKIYPTLVIKGTKLYDDWLNHKYKAIGAETSAEIIAKAYPFIPSYCRVMRIQRDIPSNIVSTTNIKTNLRQIVESKLKQLTSKGTKIWEIRYREWRGQKISSTQ
ncbi:MAG: tRNA uridine(34) 5-carboxymethylaminomethyl modification radical SAM/GNAT enzyme Elp3, partial [Nitrospiraceae bacterium]|nr:tRNA uridine(34) 5-carboxymethylaminomethyl modification radical SAM/GNAT enzyme Elp3 [Nitrospiraceae bacterium]